MLVYQGLARQCKSRFRYKTNYNTGMDSFRIQFYRTKILLRHLAFVPHRWSLLAWESPVSGDVWSSCVLNRAVSPFNTVTSVISIWICSSASDLLCSVSAKWACMSGILCTYMASTLVLFELYKLDFNSLECPVSAAKIAMEGKK